MGMFFSVTVNTAICFYEAWLLLCSGRRVLDNHAAETNTVLKKISSWLISSTEDEYVSVFRCLSWKFFMWLYRFGCTNVFSNAKEPPKYVFKAYLKAVFCIKLIELRAGDVISLKLAAKLSYKSIMLGKPQQNERSKGMCLRTNAIRGGVTAPLLHHRLEGAQAAFHWGDVLSIFLPSRSPFVQCWHFSGRASWGFLWAWQEENSLVVKQSFKTKCSIESKLAAPLCAFFEMSSDFKKGTCDLWAPLVYFLLWLPLVVFPGVCSPQIGLGVMQGA